MKMKVSMMVLALLLATSAAGDSPSLSPKNDTVADDSKVECIPCDVLFSQLTSTESGGRVQDIQMQLRGEPKSGTGFIHQWASGLLYHACDFLKRSFGEDTCSVTWTSEDLSEQPVSYTNRSLVFEPRLRGADAPCSCDNVDRTFTCCRRRRQGDEKRLQARKAHLPVDPSCPWWHPNRIVAHDERSGAGCKTFKGSSVANYSDLVGCMQEAACQITDDRAQLVILRDPRAIAVSSYFHRRNGLVIDPEITLHKLEYVPHILPNICKWISMRHVLFSGLLQDRSTVFWYNDAVARPLAAHRTFSDSVGLHLPSPVVEEAVDAALRGDFPFVTKQMDVHWESDPEEVVVGRTWRDEVGGDEDFVAELDAVLRVWLPPVLLAKWGLALAV